jgi:hypothetical protein
VLENLATVKTYSAYSSLLAMFVFCDLFFQRSRFGEKTSGFFDETLGRMTQLLSFTAKLL